MAKAKKAKKLSGAKKTAAKTLVRAKSKRGKPKQAKHRKRVGVTNVATTGGNEAPVLAARVAVADRDGPDFPYLWPALGMMRLWLGPRKSPRA
ncbi:MAG: hypothetical protein E6G97_08720 [Alphaproteobacteria bacterium]|nr:MAG: hypothetical protein E6G97_08720 [Alphaproteobacteria bacterium]